MQDRLTPIRKALADKILEIAIGTFVVGVMSLGGMYLNSQIKTLQQMVTVTQEIQVELTRQGQNIVYLVQEVRRVDVDSRDRFTRTESMSQNDRLEGKIDANTKHIDQNKQRIRAIETRLQGNSQ